jgi:hypothetical protein
MRPKEKNNSYRAVQFEKHQPERRSRAGANLFCNGGCCCCCCCLHALGGLIGAAVASYGKSASRTEGPVVGSYWTFVAFLSGAVFVWGMSKGVGATGGGADLGVISLLLLLPVAQLLASFLTFIWIGIWSPSFPDKKASLLLLGKITLYSFLWALAGLFIMVVGFKMFS